MLKRLLLLSVLFAGQAWAADKYWNPTDGTNWNTAANWTPSGVPGTSDTAIFNSDTNNSGCVINTSIDVAGILITNYTGTITQGPDHTVTIGASEYLQYSGTFSGGNTDFTTRGFTLAGGTFTSPSAILLINNTTGTSLTIFTWTGGIFNHNGGTLKLYSRVDVDADVTHYINLSSQSMSVNNLVLSGANSTGPHRGLFYDIGASDTLLVEGNLLFEPDIGIDPAEYSEDIVGTSRPQGGAWDIGAFEWVTP